MHVFRVAEPIFPRVHLTFFGEVCFVHTRDDLYRKRGLPVGSGVVESACEQIVSSRFKGGGRYWSKAGANALLAVKCCFKDNRWADFLDWRACSAAAA